MSNELETVTAQRDRLRRYILARKAMTNVAKLARHGGEEAIRAAMREVDESHQALIDHGDLDQIDN